MSYNDCMVLKPQDVVMLLAVSLRSNAPWTTRSLGADLFLSPAEVSEGISRQMIEKAACLLAPLGQRVVFLGGPAMALLITDPAARGAGRHLPLAATLGLSSPRAWVSSVGASTS